ncbi:hypothetical protein AB3R30_12900 [Leptolyngbyaceae cyanobacterium UHCC 1019]
MVVNETNGLICAVNLSISHHPSDITGLNGAASMPLVEAVQMSLQPRREPIQIRFGFS